MKFLICFYIFLCGFRESSSGYFTAISQMEELLPIDNFVKNSLRRYTMLISDKLGEIKRFLEKLKIEQKKSNKEEYFDNPIHGYLIVKRLTLDWEKIKNSLLDDPGLGFIEDIKAVSKNKFPTQEDLGGAIEGIIKLQDTYNLDPSDIANGKIKNVQYNTKLSAKDCFDIAMKAQYKNDFYHMKSWMTAAYERYKNETVKTIKKPIIFYHLSYSVFQQGDVKSALALTNKILKIRPDDEEALKDKNHYQGILEGFKKGKKKGDDEIVVCAKRKYYEGRRITDKLCNNELKIEEDVKAELKCRYVDFGRAFLKLARFKTEELYPDPKIVLYHDVVTDEEIEILKRLAKPRFKRGTVYHSGLKKYLNATYRISESSWLPDIIHPSIAAINRRIEDMTGLNLESSEFLQVVNYGIDGYYTQHYDFFNVKDQFHKDGNRIATVLFYLSDVRQGGATVFPTIRVAVLPKKGAALLWYNILPSGEPDYLTFHAACPVLTGSKWVASKMIHERGQEFRRPCGLNKDDV